MKDQPQTQDPQPGIVINGKMLSLAAGLVLMFGVMKDVIVFFYDISMRVKIHDENIEELDETVDAIVADNGSIDRLETLLGSVTGSMDSIKAEARATRDRGFESDQSLQRDIDRLDSAISEMKAELKAMSERRSEYQGEIGPGDPGYPS